MLSLFLSTSIFILASVAQLATVAFCSASIRLTDAFLFFPTFVKTKSILVAKSAAVVVPAIISKGAPFSPMKNRDGTGTS